MVFVEAGVVEQGEVAFELFGDALLAGLGDVLEVVVPFLLAAQLARQGSEVLGLEGLATE